MKKTYGLTPREEQGFFSDPGQEGPPAKGVRVIEILSKMR
jgi:hypothetical protein